MVAVLLDTSIKQFQLFTNEVYGLPNIRHFEISEMLNNVQRFCMRGLKGIRKNDFEKTKLNLIIALSFFVSILNRLKIDLEDSVWKRFPYLCSYCNSCPCACKEKKPEQRIIEINRDESRKPGTVSGFQKMFNEVYPSYSRNLEHAGIHLAEELGEFSEAILAYRSNRSENGFNEIVEEAADFFSCLCGVFNSIKINLAEELSKTYMNNCHACNKAPCVCSYEIIKNFKS